VEDEGAEGAGAAGDPGVGAGWWDAECGAGSGVERFEVRLEAECGEDRLERRGVVGCGEGSGGGSEGSHAGIVAVRAWFAVIGGVRVGSIRRRVGAQFQRRTQKTQKTRKTQKHQLHQH
jgi:hypothetical protein